MGRNSLSSQVKTRGASRNHLGWWFSNVRCIGITKDSGRHPESWTLSPGILIHQVWAGVST